MGVILRLRVFAGLIRGWLWPVCHALGRPYLRVLGSLSRATSGGSIQNLNSKLRSHRALAHGTHHVGH